MTTIVTVEDKREVNPPWTFSMLDETEFFTIESGDKENNGYLYLKLPNEIAVQFCSGSGRKYPGCYLTKNIMADQIIKRVDAVRIIINE